MDNHQKNLNNVEQAGDQANKGDTLQKAIESYEKRLHIAREACDRAAEAKAYLNLGVVYMSHNDLPKAMECYEKSLPIAREACDRKTEGKAYLCLGFVYSSRNDLPKAIECYEKSLPIAREACDRDTEGKVYLCLGFVYQSRNDLPKAMECYEKSLPIAREACDRNTEGKAYLNLGFVYKSRNDLPKAVECYEKSLPIAREACDRDTEGKAYFNLGLVYQSRNDLPKAIECYEKSLPIAREACDRDTEGKALLNLYLIYKSRNDLPKAMECYEKSLPIAREACDRDTEGKAYLGLGLVYQCRNDLPKAIECYEKSLSIAREACDRDTEGKAYLGLSLVYESRNDLPKAMECYKKILPIAREACDRKTEGKAYLNLGLVYKSRNDLPKAIECYEKSLLIGREACDRNTEGKAYLNLGLVYQSRNDLPKAMECYEKSLPIAREACDRDTEGKAYLNLYLIYKSRNDLPKAMECYEKSLPIAREACDRDTEGKAYLCLGLVYQSRSDLPKAIECYEKSLPIAREACDRDTEGKAYLSLGLVYESRNDLPKAMECYEKSLPIAREACDRKTEGKAYLNLGFVYQSRNDLPKAMECYEKSLPIAREACDRDTEGKAYLNLGLVYQSRNDLPKAMECYEKSLPIAREACDRATEGKAYLNLGLVYSSRNDLPKAIECYEKSLPIVWEACDRATEGKAYLGLGLVLKSCNDLPNAIEICEKVLNIFRKAGDRTSEGRAYLNLGIVYKSRGNLPKAIECYDKASNIASEAADRAGVIRASQYLENCHLALGDFLKASKYGEKINGVDAYTEEATEGPASKIQGTPPEIDLRGPRALEAYNRALTEGRTRVRRIPIMLIGQDRSGKTSLKKSLQGLRFNPDEGSTVGIDVDLSYFKVTTEIWKTGKKDQAANKEEMAASFEHHVARLVVENLREQELTSEVKTMDKSKDLESSLTISTEAQIVSESNEIPEDHQGLSDAIVLDEVGSPADSFSTAQIETEDYADYSKSSGAALVVGGSQVFQTTETNPAPTKARNNTVPLGMMPKEIEMLIKKLRDKVDQMDSEDDIYSVLWDFAGQSVYYETHQLFLTSRAIYLLVYDLSWDPEGSAEPVRKQGVFGKIEEKSCTKTNLDYLDYWMTSVSSQSSRIEDHDLYSASTSTALPKTIPPVFLVCTHSDQPFKRNDPSELAINVYGFLKTKSYGEQLFDVVFKVDNTKSGTQDECPEVKRLRERILAVAKELPQTKENIPVKWLKYEKALQAVLDYGHKCITIEHAKRIASEVCKIHEEEEFVTVLNFLHDQRILIHFDDTVELNKLVVLDPQWLIDVFKTVITVKRYDQQERGLNDLWLKLEREGILEERLLRHAWGQVVGEHHTFESLIAIMERFSLLCSWSSSNESNSKEYLVPSMLRWYPPQEITKLITSASLPSLFVKFKSGQVPSNLFPRLVVQLLQWGRNEFWSRVDPQLYKSFARIYTAEDKNYSVVLLCHSSMIEVVVHKGNARSPKDDLQTDLGISPGDQRDSFEVFCAREVFRQLVLLLECLRKEFCWLKRMEYQAGIICPVCCHKTLVDYCDTHHKQDCEQEECLHFIPESELRKSNHHIICTRSAVAVDNTVYSKDFTAWFASPREETTTAAANVGRLSCSRRESEDKSFDLPGNIVESLVSSSYDPKEILHLDQTDVEQATPETTIKDSSQIDVVKPLRDTTPEKTTESEDKSVTLPGNVVESLASPSSHPKEIVLQLKENLHLDQTDLEKPTPETTRMIRCFAETAKNRKRIDVVKHLREITPAGTTGPLLPGKLDVWDIPVEKMRELTIDLTVTDWQWKVVAERLGLRTKEIEFLDMRYPNPCEALLKFVAQYQGMNVDCLYDVLTECGMPKLADTF
ncbi:uncharacterized protein LOC114970883 isoform X6 [Acropora millepora]|uniref:uncharacterized protein LOC114970883 isoform X6 n=1 Tax=Acropora millepora TaxID=45264 RepID=UPI001CF31472|nr:uncharacterized protein LOC114970883 isoform X6 [Acropora millepora]